MSDDPKKTKKPKFMQKILGSNKEKADVIQTKLKGEATLYMGDPTLQWGVGGWVRGRANLIAGIFGSGKSSLALIGAGTEQQKTHGVVLIFDSEYNYKDPHELDNDGNPTEDAIAGRKRLAAAGIDWEMTIIKRSNEVDNLFEDLEQIKEDLKNDPTCISAMIIDSWGGIQSEGAKNKIADGEFAGAGNSFGGNAKTMGPILQELLRLCSESAVTLFMVQHMMKNMDQYGDPYILIGGEKLKYLAHVILFLEPSKAKDGGLLADGTISESHDQSWMKVGKKIKFKCEKSRSVVEGRRGEFFMNFQDLKFALPEVSLFNLACQLGIIGHPKTPVLEKDGSPKVDKKGIPEYKENKMYWEWPVGAPTPRKFHGAANTIKELGSDKELFDAVKRDCFETKKTDATKEEEVHVEDSNKKRK